MWNNNTRKGDGDDDDKEKTVAKTAGFVVFSGIAMSILKALNPYNKNTISTTNNNNEATKESASAAAQLTESTQPPPPPPPQEPIIKAPPPPPPQEPIIKAPPPPPPPQEPIIKKPSYSEVKAVLVEPSPPETSLRSIEIVKGDTLWGLSRKYGVSIEAIKEANGLTGDTIYAGKKLIIP